MSAMQRLVKNERVTYSIAILVSLLISLWMSAKVAVINPDAVCYLMAAKAVGEGGVHGAMTLCGQASWPFYSLLIYQFVHLTHVSYAAIAYGLDALFSAVSVFTFILIAKTLGGTKRIMWFAAATILLAHEFNSVREYIIRDHGFWAFYLLSFYFLLRYFTTPSTWVAIAFNASLLVASLFRIEGIFFLMALPFLALFYQSFSMKERFHAFFRLNTLTLFAGMFLVIWLILHPQQTLTHLGRLVEIPEQFRHGLALISDRYVAARNALAQHVLTADSAKEASLVMMVMLMAWYLMSVIGNLSWPYTIMVIYAWSRRFITLSPSARLVWWGYIAINVFVTFMFLLERFFLSKRYLIALSLVLMLWVPFVLDDLWKKRRAMRYRVLFAVLTLWIAIAGWHSMLNRGYSKAYIEEAGSWIATHIPKEAMLYTNDPQLMYYTDHYDRQLFEKARIYTDMNAIANNKWRQFDYLALRIHQKEASKRMAELNGMSIIPIKIFQNKRHDQVVVYRVINEERQP
ncbi:MAG: hypothetical protein A3F14_01805 [Gammaproteobacteria bacterium RIFCSPHIGHO2_12_FULL_43_28]|nr:MAG: hypothetical protein A3F14_01805 [Gammaproteobacteria bacterium RIFCSPHIGHO2_12_FULL_43_28]